MQNNADKDNDVASVSITIRRSSKFFFFKMHNFYEKKQSAQNQLKCQLIRCVQHERSLYDAFCFSGSGVESGWSASNSLAVQCPDPIQYPCLLLSSQRGFPVITVAVVPFLSLRVPTCLGDGFQIHNLFSKKHAILRSLHVSLMGPSGRRFLNMYQKIRQPIC